MKTAPRFALGLAAVVLALPTVSAGAASSLFKKRPAISEPMNLMPRTAAASSLEPDFDAVAGLPARAGPPILLPRPVEPTKQAKKRAAIVPLPRPNPRRPVQPLPEAVSAAPGAIATASQARPEPVPAPDAGLVTGSTAVAPTPPAAPSEAVSEAPEIVPPPPPAPAFPPIVIPDQAPPFELVRILQLIQDRIAAGSAEALTAQRDLSARIDHDIAAADPALWQDPRNATAAVTYVLSGGPPAALKHLLSLAKPPAIEDKLIRGALAYVEGREAEALALLGDIDATALPASIGGQTALAQAALAVRADPAKSMALLDTARLLAPGTLVEEAALRREIFIADQIGDQEKFEGLSRRYLQRFRHSVYAGNFRNRFAAALSHMKLLDNPDEFGQLATLLDEVEPAGRVELYLIVARAAAVQMKMPVAALAAEQARRLAGAGTREEARARLYGAAALVVTPKNLETALADLQAIDRDKLSASDRALFEAVSGTAESIESADAHPGAATSPDVPLAEMFEKVPDMAAKATQLLEATNALVEKKS